jgi:peptidoglycan/LPS O-acetylase OafA/YrhL
VRYASISMQDTKWKNYGDTDFITGMRAYAAFAVVLIHLGGGGLRSLGDIGNMVADLGHAGVYAFFVISGFAVASALDSDPTYGQYLTRRMMRIVPLYYFWLVVAAAISADQPSLYNWLMHLTFLSVADYKITNSIIGVEWSIPIEVFWYLLLPFLLKPMFSKRWGIPVAVVVSFFIYKASRVIPEYMPMPPGEAFLAMHWSPLPYVFSYCLGAAAFRIRPILAPLASNLVIGFVLFLFALYAVSSTFRSYSRASEFFAVTAFTFVLICLGSSKNTIYNRLFTTRACMLLGTYSFGIYLCHVPLHGLVNRLGVAPDNATLKFLLVSALAVLISAVTYRLIEQPFQNLGKRLQIKREVPSPAQR